MVSFQVAVDAAHGARVTSLVDPSGREWLWRRDAPGRGDVRPGDAFVDVGGAEECFPTISGTPDHGDAWSRPWTDDGEWLTVETGDCRLGRRVRVGAEVTLDYRLTGPAGYAFIWAFHALLEPDLGLRVVAPEGHPVQAWPGHVRPVATTWPRVLDIAGYDVLGPDDGSAMFCVLPDLETISVESEERRLSFALRCEGQPVAMAVWRNLGGYPWDGTPNYRNFGIEPMLGQTIDPAAPGRVAAVPVSGALGWQLVITAGEVGRRPGIG